MPNIVLYGVVLIVTFMNYQYFLLAKCHLVNENELSKCLDGRPWRSNNRTIVEIHQPTSRNISLCVGGHKVADLCGKPHNEKQLDSFGRSATVHQSYRSIHTIRMISWIITTIG